jgi:hypothetical protein
MQRFDSLLVKVRTQLQTEFSGNLVTANVPEDMKSAALKTLCERFESAAADALKFARIRLSDSAVKEGDAAIQAFTQSFTYKVLNFRINFQAIFF